MPRKFNAVFSLWITPDFSDVMAGKSKPPRVDHSKIDFKALVTLFEEFFPYGPPVTIRVPNDAIDQVTVHMRLGRGAAMRCEDFGVALLAAAKKQKGPVIDVSTAWQGLHVLPDRTLAPPPVILPILVTAEDFEDAMFWHANTRPCLGMPVFDALASATGKAPNEVPGQLPDAIQERLRAIFGSPFEKICALDRMATDKPPKVYEAVLRQSR